jgi:hypothetical protein
VPPESSPEACALAGFPPAARARVVSSHVNGDLAALYVLTEEGADWLSIVRRDDEGWTELGGGDGGFIWVDTDDDADDRGVLACAIPVNRPGDYLVRYADSSTTVRTAEPYVVAVLGARRRGRRPAPCDAARWLMRQLPPPPVLE